MIYLPPLAEQVGIPRRAVIWLLMVDQLLFLASDYACGVMADRMARLNGRFGPRVRTASDAGSKLLNSGSSASENSA